jgi:sensor domain CHASE-containing protein
MEIQHGSQLLSEVAQRSNSELIYFFIIVAVVLAIVCIPMYRMMLKERKERLIQESIRQERYIEREREIIKVISENSAVIAGLKATFELTGASNHSSFSRVHERLDEIIQHNTTVKVTLDEVIRRQQTISADIKHGFSEIRKYYEGVQRNE